MHRYVNAILRIFVASRAQQQWDDLLPFAELAYRCTPLMGSSLTPFQLQYGRPPRLPVDLLFSAEPPQPTTRNEWAERQTQVMREAHTDFANLLRDRKLKQKMYFDVQHHPVSYHADEKPGGKVLLWRPARTDGVARKLGHEFHGTFRAIDRKGLCTYVVRNVSDAADVREAHVRHLRPCRFNADSDSAACEGRLLEFRDTSVPAGSDNSWVCGVVTEVLSHGNVRVRIVEGTTGLPSGRGCEPAADSSTVTEFAPSTPCLSTGCSRSAGGRAAEDPTLAAFCCRSCPRTSAASHDYNCTGPATAETPSTSPRPRARWASGVLKTPETDTAAVMALEVGSTVLLDLRSVDHRWLLREAEQHQRDEAAKSLVRVLSLELGDFVLFASPNGSEPASEEWFVGRVDEVDRSSGRVLAAVHDCRKSGVPLAARVYETVLVDLVSGERVISSRVAGRPNFEIVYARLASKDLRAGPFLLTNNQTLPPEVLDEWA